MAPLTHHGTAIRFICDHLWAEVHRQIDIEKDTPRVDRLREAVVPLVPGTSIVMACSYVERVSVELRHKVPDSGAPEDLRVPAVGGLRDIQRYFALDRRWQGWDELANFFRLRHCFAHELGLLTDRQRDPVTEFLEQLRRGAVLWEGAPVAPYYDIDAQGGIVMTDGWNARLRLILVHFLRLFSKHGLNLEK